MQLCLPESSMPSVSREERPGLGYSGTCYFLMEWESAKRLTSLCKEPLLLMPTQRITSTLLRVCLCIYILIDLLYTAEDESRVTIILDKCLTTGRYSQPLLPVLILTLYGYTQGWTQRCSWLAWTLRLRSWGEDPANGVAPLVGGKPGTSVLVGNTMLSLLQVPRCQCWGWLFQQWWWRGLSSQSWEFSGCSS